MTAQISMEEWMSAQAMCSRNTKVSYCCRVFCGFAIMDFKIGFWLLAFLFYSSYLSRLRSMVGLGFVENWGRARVC